MEYDHFETEKASKIPPAPIKIRLNYMADYSVSPATFQSLSFSTNSEEQGAVRSPKRKKGSLSGDEIVVSPYRMGLNK